MAGDHYSKIFLPSANFSKIKTKRGWLINMPGIFHFIIFKEVNKPEVMEILDKNNLLTKKAAGIISVINQKNKFKITPFVWVCGTQTLYKETACASGTLALAYLLKSCDKGNNFVVIQPSGSKFIAECSGENISLSGPILGTKKQEISIGKKEIL